MPQNVCKTKSNVCTVCAPLLTSHHILNRHFATRQFNASSCMYIRLNFIIGGRVWVQRIWNTFSILVREKRAHESVHFVIDIFAINVEPVRMTVRRWHNLTLRPLLAHHTQIAPDGFVECTNRKRVPNQRIPSNRCSRKLVASICITKYRWESSRIPFENRHNANRYHSTYTTLRPMQECIAETQDWRKCQSAVKDFRDCMAKYSEEQRKKYE